MDAEPGLLIFDGDCGFCTASVRFVARWVDRRGRYGVRPWQELDLTRYGLTEAQCLEAAQFVRADGTVLAGYRAVAEALRQGAPGWRPFGALLEAPVVSRVADAVYRWVADHRYALPGGTAACVPGARAASQ